jgi:uncharacterized membrane protein
LCYGLSWWPFKQLQALGLHPLWATVLVDALVLAGILLFQPRVLGRLLRNRALWPLLIAAGCTNVGFNWAVTIGDVVRVVLLFYLMPLWAALLAWPLLGEKPTLRSVGFMLLALAGVVLVLKTPETPWPWPQDMADVLALGGGFSFALTNVLLRRLRDSDALSITATMLLGGALLCAGVGQRGFGVKVTAVGRDQHDGRAGVELAKLPGRCPTRQTGANDDQGARALRCVWGGDRVHLDRHHFKVGLGHAAVRTGPGLGHIGPQGSGGEAVFGAASGLVVHKATHDADIGFHGFSLNKRSE